MIDPNTDYMLAAHGDEAAKERVRKRHEAYKIWEHMPPVTPPFIEPSGLEQFFNFLWIVAVNIVALAFLIALFVKMVMFFVGVF